jgi:predicted transcriptional regulator
VKKCAFIASTGTELLCQRKALGLSQSELAQAIGVSASAIASWERGVGVMSAYSHHLLRQFFKDTQAQRQLHAAGDVKSAAKMRATGDCTTGGCAL